LENKALKDVTCSDPSKIINDASIQKVSETYDLDLEKIKGEIQIFRECIKNTPTPQNYPQRYQNCKKDAIFL
jgi:hypothetical protein